MQGGSINKHKLINKELSCVCTPTLLMTRLDSHTIYFTLLFPSYCTPTCITSPMNQRHIPHPHECLHMELLPPPDPLLTRAITRFWPAIHLQYRHNTAVIHVYTQMDRDATCNSSWCPPSGPTGMTILPPGYSTHTDRHHITPQITHLPPTAHRRLTQRGLSRHNQHK